MQITSREKKKERKKRNPHRITCTGPVKCWTLLMGGCGVGGAFRNKTKRQIVHLDMQDERDLEHSLRLLVDLKTHSAGVLGRFHCSRGAYIQNLSKLKQIIYMMNSGRWSNPAIQIISDQPIHSYLEILLQFSSQSLITLISPWCCKSRSKL